MNQDFQIRHGSKHYRPCNQYKHRFHRSHHRSLLGGWSVKCFLRNEFYQYLNFMTQLDYTNTTFKTFTNNIGILQYLELLGKSFTHSNLATFDRSNSFNNFQEGGITAIFMQNTNGVDQRIGSEIIFRIRS